MQKKGFLLHIKRILQSIEPLEKMGLDVSGMINEAEKLLFKWKEELESMPVCKDINISTVLSTHFALECDEWIPVTNSLLNSQGGIAWSIHYKNTSEIENGVSRIGRWANRDGSGKPSIELSLDDIKNTDDIYLY